MAALPLFSNVVSALEKDSVCERERCQVVITAGEPIFKVESSTPNDPNGILRKFVCVKCYFEYQERAKLMSNYQQTARAQNPSLFTTVDGRNRHPSEPTHALHSSSSSNRNMPPPPIPIRPAPSFRNMHAGPSYATGPASFDPDKIHQSVNASQKREATMSQRMPTALPRNISGTNVHQMAKGYNKTHNSDFYNAMKQDWADKKYATSTKPPGSSKDVVPVMFSMVYQLAAAKSATPGIPRTECIKPELTDTFNIPIEISSQELADFAYAHLWEKFTLACNSYPFKKANCFVRDLKNWMNLTTPAQGPQLYLKSQCTEVIPAASGSKGKAKANSNPSPIYHTPNKKPFQIGIVILNKDWIQYLEWSSREDSDSEEDDRPRMRQALTNNNAEKPVQSNAKRANGKDSHRDRSDSMKKRELFRSDTTALSAHSRFTMDPGSQAVTNSFTPSNAIIARPADHHPPAAEAGLGNTDYGNRALQTKRRTRSSSANVSEPPAKRIAEAPPSPDRDMIFRGLIQAGGKNDKDIIPLRAIVHEENVLYFSIPSVDRNTIFFPDESSNLSLGRFKPRPEDGEAAVLSVTPVPFAYGAFKTAHIGYLTLHHLANPGEIGCKSRHQVVAKRLYDFGAIESKQDRVDMSRSKLKLSVVPQVLDAMCRYDPDDELSLICKEATILRIGDALLRDGHTWTLGRMKIVGKPPFELPDLRFIKAGIAQCHSTHHVSGAPSGSVSSMTRSYLLEEVMPSHEKEFVKYVHNGDASKIPFKKGSDNHHIAQYLCYIQHVQFIRNKRLVYVSDFQGAGGLLTDPQIMTAPSLAKIAGDMFGQGNVSAAFAKFVSDHEKQCKKNIFCQFFKPEPLSQYAEAIVISDEDVAMDANVGTGVRCNAEGKSGDRNADSDVEDDDDNGKQAVGSAAGGERGVGLAGDEGCKDVE